MSNYVKLYDLAAKDSLITGDPNKLVRGVELDAELTAIASAIQTKSNVNGFIGTATATSPAASDNSTRVATTEFTRDLLDEITLISGGTF